MLDKVRDILKKDEIISFKLPRHIALVTRGKHIYREKHKISLEEIGAESTS